MSSGIARTVARAGDRTACRSYVSDDLSFGEGGNDVSFQLPDDRSFGSTELIFLTNQNDVILAGQNDAVLDDVQPTHQLFLSFFFDGFFFISSNKPLSLSFSLSSNTPSPVSPSSSPTSTVVGGKIPLLSALLFSEIYAFLS